MLNCVAMQEVPDLGMFFNRPRQENNDDDYNGNNSL